jgi:hypothetical protein
MLLRTAAAGLFQRSVSLNVFVAGSAMLVFSWVKVGSGGYGCEMGGLWCLEMVMWVLEVVMWCLEVLGAAGDLVLSWCVGVPVWCCRSSCVGDGSVACFAADLVFTFCLFLVVVRS